MPWSLVRLFVNNRKRRRERGLPFDVRTPHAPRFDPVLAAFERESG